MGDDGRKSKTCSSRRRRGVAAGRAPARLVGLAWLLLIAAGPAVAQQIATVSIGAGSFTMGRLASGDDGALGFGDELPRHPVTLSAYRIGRQEVSAAQFASLLNWALGQGLLEDAFGGAWSNGDPYHNGERLAQINLSTSQVGFSQGAFAPRTRNMIPLGEHAMTSVTWYGAVAFCNWLSLRQGLAVCYDLTTWQLLDAEPATPGQQYFDGYRLPTEAEWERAAAWDGARHWIYGFAEDTLTDSTRANHRLQGGAFVDPLNMLVQPLTSPVGWFDGEHVSPNGPVETELSLSPAGCFDMSGNAWEWVWDRYGPYPATAQTDPTGPTIGTTRVMRGGSWLTQKGDCRTARRRPFQPSQFPNDAGFRIATSNLSPPGTPVRWWVVY